MPPKVSIITPLHNKGAYITETVESALIQTMPDWEMIVVENHSTDDGPSVVQRYAQHHTRVRYFEAPPHVCGPGAARNYGLAHATGQWILFLDADDLIEPEHLDCLLAAASTAAMSPIVAGYWQEFTAGAPGRRSLKPPFCIGKDQAFLKASCIAFAPWAIHAALVQRAVLRPAYQWPVELDHGLAEDIHFWFKLILDYPVTYAKCHGALYRILSCNHRNQFKDISNWYTGLHATVQCNCDYLHRRGLEPDANQCENLMRLYSELFCQATTQARPDIAEEALGRALGWLRKRQALKPPLSTLNRLRIMLGLRHYSMLRYRLLKFFQ
jgi:glycosyltransferase involved in cell wall biosynthesis